MLSPHAFFKGEHFVLANSLLGLGETVSTSLFIHSHVFPVRSSATHNSYATVLPRTQTIYHKGSPGGDSSLFLTFRLESTTQFSVSVGVDGIIGTATSDDKISFNQWYDVVVSLEIIDTKLQVTLNIDGKPSAKAILHIESARTSTVLQDLVFSTPPFHFGALWDCNTRSQDLKVADNSHFIGFLQNFAVTTAPSTDFTIPSWPADSPDYLPPVWTFMSMEDLKNFDPKSSSIPNNFLLPPWQRPALPNRSRLLACHDTRVGDEALLQGGNDYGKFWNFEQWRSCDIFVYFTHERVSVPPPAFIAAAHKNNTLILGTFNTEWESGERDNLLLLDGYNGDEFYYAKQLISLAEYWNIDGWFFNIESGFPEETREYYAKKMMRFLQYLTTEIHRKLPNSLIIWYDSLTVEGKVRWQNELTHLNKAFFDCWNVERIQRSAELAGSRKHDVYVGNDMWGRGTYEGGGFRTYRAIKEIKALDLSAALFAPTWTMYIAGKNDRTAFELSESRLWKGFGYIDLMWRKFEDLVPWTVTEKGNGFECRSREEAKITEDRFVNGRGPGAITPASSDAVLVASYDWSTRSREYDLKKLFPKWYSDQSNVRLLKIVASEWIIGTGPNVKDPFKLRIRLLSENETVIQECERQVEASADWYEVKIELDVSRENGIRYIQWFDAGKDAEHWAGHYGVKMSNPSLVIIYRDDERESTKSIHSFYPPRSPIHRLPFATNFATGVGKKFFVEGSEVSSVPWTNYNEQSVRLTFEVHNNVNECITNVALDQMNAFDGGSSVLISLIPCRCPSLQIAQMDTTNMPRVDFSSIEQSAIQNLDSIKIKVVVKRSKAINIGLLFKFDPEQAHALYMPTKSENRNGYEELSFLVPVANVRMSPRIAFGFIRADTAESLSELHDVRIGLLTVASANTKNSEQTCTLLEKDKDIGYSSSYNPKGVYEGCCEYVDVLLYWKPLAMNIRHYDVFVDNNFVGRAFSTQYCLTCLPSGREALVTVVPVDELFNRLSPLTMNMNRMRMFN